MPAIVKDVKWGEDNSIDVAPTLSEEELDILKKRMLAMDKLLADQQVAKYKIEIMFTRLRSRNGHYPGAISLWESGSKLHGGGDAKLYECPGKSLGKNECMGIIPDVSNGYGFLVCPTCKEVWKGEQVHGEIMARNTTQNWAILLLKYFARLDHNADLYMKHPREDIRVAAKLEQEKQLGGEKLAKARAGMRLAIYPLRNLIKDSATGADLLGRISAFLHA